MASDTYRQYVLQQGDTMMVCWLAHSKKLKEGAWLTLKNVPGVWTIKAAYATELVDPPLTKWQVGGLP